ncbi:MAG TPA: ABC transporter permease [Solirubrobacteraceae bacterium]|nr:ABC transporter permease [Solirubrobacteraceae bacterium]
MLPRDVLAQALTAPLNRPGRSLLTILGTVLGVGMLVTTLGLTSSAHAQINTRFDALDSTEVDAQGASATTTAPVITDAERTQALGLLGVRAAGVIRSELTPQPTVTLGPGPGAVAAAQESGSSPNVMSASVGALAVIAPTLSEGTLYTTTEQDHAAHVALLGVAAARQLGLNHVPATIYIDGTLFLAQGIISNTERENQALLDVVIPDTTEQQLLPNNTANAAPTLIVATRLGYATAIGQALATAIYPTDPAAVTVTTPPNPQALGAAVSSDITGLFVVLALVGLIVGIVGIANTTLVSVLERVPEIGLRRAIGARKTQIATQMLLESLTLGTLGGLFGDALGLTAVAAIALLKGWAPVAPLWIIILAPLVGTITGLLAGAYPAIRAASVDPAIALAR